MEVLIALEHQKVLQARAIDAVEIKADILEKVPI